VLIIIRYRNLSVSCFTVLRMCSVRVYVHGCHVATLSIGLVVRSANSDRDGKRKVCASGPSFVLVFHGGDDGLR